MNIFIFTFIYGERLSSQSHDIYGKNSFYRAAKQALIERVTYRFNLSYP